MSLYNDIDRSTDNDRKQPNCSLGVKWISEFHLAHTLIYSAALESVNRSYTNHLDTWRNAVLGKQSKQKIDSNVIPFIQMSNHSKLQYSILRRCKQKWYNYFFKKSKGRFNAQFRAVVASEGRTGM